MSRGKGSQKRKKNNSPSFQRAKARYWQTQDQKKRKMLNELAEVEHQIEKVKKLAEWQSKNDRK